MAIGQQLKITNKAAATKPRTTAALNIEKNNRLDYLLKQKDYDGIERLVDIAKDENTPLEMRVSIAKTIAEYQYPKKRAIEVKDTSGDQINVKKVMVVQKRGRTETTEITGPLDAMRQQNVSDG